MSQAYYKYKIQDPLVFVNCFRRPHFARQVIEGIFRHKVKNITSGNLVITDFLKDDGEIGYAAVFENLQLPGNLKATVVFNLDMSEKVIFTARKIVSSLFAASYGQPIFVITFTSRVPTVSFSGSVLKFTMCDVVGNRLCDLRWEYFVCCDHGDKIDSKFLTILCRMLRGKECNTDEAQIIEDAATVVMADMSEKLQHTVTEEMICTLQKKLAVLQAAVKEDSAIVADSSKVEEIVEGEAVQEVTVTSES